jgi:integrase
MAKAVCPRSQSCTQSGLPLVTFHGLRHSHITQLLEAGVHPKIASERAGHSSVAITLDIYSHAVPDMQVEAAHNIDADNPTL